MRDFILTAPTEADLITALPEYRVQSEDSEQWAGNVFAPCTRWISRPTYDAEGEQTSPGETAPGYHLILRAESLPEAAQQYLVTDPGDIEPVPAGGLLVPEAPESVERLQARLALIAAGLWDSVVAYFSDPSRTAEDLAFWEDALIWKRDNPIIISAGTALGLTSEQIDALFVDAATR